jgi:hypothetical protein
MVPIHVRFTMWTMTTTFPRPAKPTYTNNTATVTTSSSHPSPTLLPSHLIVYRHSPVPSYITMKRANLTLDDKMPDWSIDLSHQSFDLNQPQPTKQLSNLSSAVKDTSDLHLHVELALMLVA